MKSVTTERLKNAFKFCREQNRNHAKHWNSNRKPVRIASISAPPRDTNINTLYYYLEIQ